MRTIIAGSRSIKSKYVIGEAVIASGFHITEVVSGAARGVDELGEQWAEEHGVPIRRFPAEWEFYGKRAGPVRNIEMAKYADALIAVWDGKSRGTKHMITQARKRGLKCFVHIELESKIMSDLQTKFKWPLLRDYDAGYVAGLQAFAWWKDGTQYVGTCGTTLQAAVDSYLLDNGYTKQPIASAKAR